MNVTFKSYASSKLKGVDAELTTLFRADATAANWPKNLVSKLKLSITNSQLVVNYPGEFTDLIEDLEYGSQNSSPQPVFRLFENKHGDVITRKLAEASLNYLVSENAIP